MGFGILKKQTKIHNNKQKNPNTTTRKKTMYIYQVDQ